MKRVTFRQLGKTGQALLKAAEAAMETAYNPYSNFFVGSALLTPSGEIITGSNVENASYGATLCSERATIARASAMGHKVFSTIAVIGRGDKAPSKEIISPCGVCRQMLFESAQLSNTNLTIIMSSTSMNKIVVATIEELLPLGFGPRNLGLNLKRFRPKRA